MRLVNIEKGQIQIEFSEWELPTISLMAQAASEQAVGGDNGDTFGRGEADSVSMYASLFSAFCDAAKYAAELSALDTESLNYYRAANLYQSNPAKAERLYPVEVAAIKAKQSAKESTLKAGDSAVYTSEDGRAFDCTIIERRADNRAYVRMSENNQPHCTTRRLYERPQEGDTLGDAELLQLPEDSELGNPITKEGEGSNTVYSYTDSETGEKHTRRLYQNWEKVQ